MPVAGAANRTVDSYITQRVSAFSAGALTLILSDVLSVDASLFWTVAVAHAALHYGFWFVVGHHGALLLPGEGAYIPLALLGLLVFICIAPTPQDSILLSLWSHPRSAVQHVWADHDQRDSLVETSVPPHTLSASGAVSREAVIPDADAAKAARIAITADGSTVSCGAMQHAGQFSDSSEMPRESAIEGQESSLHAPTVTNEALTAVDHLNLVRFWLGKLRKSTDCPRQADLTCWTVFVWACPTSLFKTALFEVCACPALPSTSLS